MGLLSKIWGGIKKIFLNPLGKLFDWLKPDVPPKDAVKIPREGSDNPVPVVYGKALVGGVKVHKWVSDIPSGMKRGYLHIIVSWCVGEIDGIEKVYFDDKNALDPDFKRDNQYMWERWDSFGAENATAIPEAVSNIENWTTNHRGQGVAHSYFRFRMDEDREMWRGEPQIKAVIRGRKIYDPRTETTAWTDNPAICLLDFLKSTRYGKGLLDSRINTQSFIDAANFCDQGTTQEITTTEYISDEDPTAPPIAVTSTTTVTKKRFTLNIAVVPQDGITNAVNDIRRNFRASLPQGNGVIRLAIEKDEDPVFSFTDDDIEGDVDFQAGSKQDRFNQVVVQFPNANKDYEKDEVSYPPMDSQEYIDAFTADNEVPLEQSFEFDGITNTGEALQMAEVIFKRSRVNGQVAFTSANPTAILLEPTDIIEVTNSTLGWVNKEFRVTNVEPAEDGTVNIGASEYNPAVYPWNGAVFSEVIGGTWLGDPFSLIAPTNLQLAPDLTLSSTGLLTWQHSADAFVRRYEVVVTNAGGIVFDVDVIGRSWTVPLIDSGAYTVTVYAVSTLTDARSGGAVLSLTLTAPSAPSSISLTVRDWEIEAIPQLAGIGLGTEFEFDIVQGDGAGHTPAAKARGSSYTSTGLTPSTVYTVFARAVNAFGASAWVSATAITTNTGVQIDPYLDAIRDELDQIELINTNFDAIKESIPDINALLEEVAQDTQEIFQRREDVDTETFKLKQEISSITVNIDDQVVALNTRLNEVEADAEGNATAISGLQLEVANVEAGLSSTLDRVDQVEIDAEGNAQAISSLQLEVSNVEASVNATLDRVDLVEVDVAGNAQAISGLQLEVSNLESGLNAAIDRVDSVEVEVDGNATAISAVSGQVNDPVNNSSALYTFTQQAQATADGAVTSITNIESRVENNEDFAAAQVTLNSFYNAELGTLGARAFLGTDVNKRVTGVFVDDDGINRRIEFVANSAAFVDGAGTLKVYYDLANSRYVFDGHLLAASGTFGGALNAASGTFTGNLSAAGGTFTGTLDAGTVQGGLVNGATVRGGAIETIGGTHMIVTRATPFGADNLISWYGTTAGNLSGGAPIYGNLTRANAIRWIDAAGEYSRDIISRRNSTTTTSVSVTHPSQGDEVTILGKGRVFAAENFTVFNQPSFSGSIVINYRLLKGGTQVASSTYSAALPFNVEQLDPSIWSLDIAFDIPLEIEYLETIGYASQAYTFQITSVVVTADEAVTPSYKSQITTTEIRQ